MRFRLLTLFLILIIVALFISNWLVYLEWQRERSRVQATSLMINELKLAVKDSPDPYGVKELYLRMIGLIERSKDHGADLGPGKKIIVAEKSWR